jgi:hypothetical protein
VARQLPGVAFERYVDDVVVHCVSQAQAQQVLAALGKRMALVGLRLHPEKTRIVYCQDANRRGSYEHTASRSWVTRSVNASCFALFGVSERGVRACRGVVRKACARG